MQWIECRGEVMPGYAPSLPRDTAEARRKAGLFLIKK